MRVENHLRRDPRIATADNHDGRGLAASCELAIALALRRHATSEEITVAFDEPGRKFRRHRWPRAHYIINARSPNEPRFANQATVHPNLFSGNPRTSPRQKGNAGERCVGVVEQLGSDET